MKNNFFNYSVANIYSKPSYNSDVSSQILYGEKFKILSKKKRWIKIKTSYDNYVGFIKKSKFLFMKTRRINRFNNNLKFYGFVFFLLGLVFFLILAIKGGGGSLWLTDSRVAYQFYRTGAGGFYVLSQILLYVSFMCFLINIKSNLFKFKSPFLLFI